MLDFFRIFTVIAFTVAIVRFHHIFQFRNMFTKIANLSSEVGTNESQSLLRAVHHINFLNYIIFSSALLDAHNSDNAIG